MNADDAFAALAGAGLGDWHDALAPIVATRFVHGDLPRWTAALDAIDTAQGDQAKLEAALLELTPWRKGPFDLGGVHIDAEWRCDRKWARVADRIEPLAGRRVLDVGCGNGWYALRMRDAGARFVFGIDPTLLYLLQFSAVARHVDTRRICLLPLRLEELPPSSRAFDTAFSMGVLYHQRSPLTHLQELRETLRSGGQLVLETLVLPGDEARAATPPGRYARMNNVWLLPTLTELRTWLARSRYRNVEIIDETPTTTDEQRQTPWMPFESLADALDPDDPARTVEGWPAPRRAVLTATAP